MPNKRKAEACRDAIVEFTLSVIDGKMVGQNLMKPKEFKEMLADMKKGREELCEDLTDIYSCDESMLVEVFAEMEAAFEEEKGKLLADFHAKLRDNETPTVGDKVVKGAKRKRVVKAK